MKTALSLALLLACLLPLFWESRLALQRINLERERVTEIHAQSLALTENLRYRVVSENNLALRFILTGELKF